MDIRIREAEESDCGTILTLVRKLAVFEKLEHEVSATEALLRKNLFGTEPYAYALLAETEGTLAGFCLYFHNFSTFTGKPGLYIEDIFVLPEFRGRGIGKHFFRRMADIAKLKDCGRIEWWVLDWNRNAIDFYESLGAKPMSEWTVYRITEQKFAALAGKEHA